MVDDIEGLFDAGPALADKLPMPHPGRSDRNTLVRLAAAPIEGE
jgi:hypothetical protein